MRKINSIWDIGKVIDKVAKDKIVKVKIGITNKFYSGLRKKLEKENITDR